MAKLFSILLYAQALWSSLVVPCVTNPDNWEQCFNNHDQWLWPEVQRGIDLITERELPYAGESDILE